MTDFVLRRVGPGGVLQSEIISDEDERGRALLHQYRGTPQIQPLTPEVEQEIARQQVRQRNIANLEETGVAPLVGAGVGVLDELTFGLGQRLMPPAAQRRLEDVREGQPIATMVGRAAPAIVGTILTGGASLGARTAGALTQGGAANLLGNAAERAILSMAGEVPGLGARAAAFGTNALVDASISGLGQAITDSNIQGTPLEGEAILANIGVGMSLGLLGAGVRTVGEIPRVRQPLIDEVRAMQEVGMGPRQPVRSADEVAIGPRPELPEDQSLFSQLQSSPLGRLVSGLDENGMRLVRQINAEGPRAFDEAGLTARTRELSVAGDDAVNNSFGTNRILQEANERQALLYRDLSDTPADAVSRAQDDLRSLRGILEVQRARDLPAGDLEAIRGLRRHLSDDLFPTSEPRVERVFSPMEPSGYREIEIPGEPLPIAPEQLAVALDNALQEARNRGWGRALTDPEADTQRTLVLEGMRNTLASLGRGGQLGARASQAVDALDMSTADLGASLGRTYQRTGQFRFNQGKLFSATTDSIYRLAEDQNAKIDNFTRDMAQLSLLRDEILGDGAGVRAATQLRDWTEAMRDAQRWGTAASNVRAVNAQLVNAAGMRAGLSTLGILGGGMLGGLPGAAAGAALLPLQHPLAASKLWMSAGRGVQRTQARMASGVSNLAASLSGAARPVGAALKTTGRLASQLRSQQDREQAYRDVLGRVQQLASNPLALEEQIASSLGDLPHTLPPAVGGAMAMSLTNATTYLASVVPPADFPSPLDHTRPDRPPSPTEMRTFLRRVEALEDPLILLDLAAAKRLSSEHVEAVAAVYPHILMEIQGQVADMLADLKTRPPYNARAMLGILLQMQTDASLAPQFVFRLQQNYSQTSAQRNAIISQSSALRSNQGNTFTSTQRIESRL